MLTYRTCHLATDGESHEFPANAAEPLVHLLALPLQVLGTCDSQPQVPAKAYRLHLENVRWDFYLQLF